MGNAQSLWYRILPVRSHPIPPGVFVSLYRDEEEIIVDGNLGLVLEAMERGDELMPVMFQYYEKGTIPINRYPELITADDVNEIFGDLDRKASLPPNWKFGDFHADMTVEEIENLARIPDKEDVDPELWDLIENDLSNNGFLIPTILASESTWDVRLFNSPERVAVAKDLGFPVIPVVLIEPPPHSQTMSLCRKLVRDHLDDPFLLSQLGNAGGPSQQPPPPMEPPPDPPKESD